MKFEATRHLAALLVTALPAVAQAQWVDFAQVDGSSDSSTFVLVRQAPRLPGAEPSPLLSASVTRWSTGQALAVGYVYRWQLAQGPQQWLVGAGVGANAFGSRAAGDEADESALSMRVQSEWLGPLMGGSYYALAQVSSFRRAGFATLQYSLPSSPLSLEASHYREATYEATSAGVRMAIGVPHLFVRVGAVRADGKSRPFVGLTYNAF